MLRTALFAIVLLAAPAARAEPASLDIELSNLTPRGAVLLQLFDTEAGYEAGEAIGGRRIEIDAETASIRFEGLESGRYAFRMFHDLNDDGQMNVNPFGIPTEPFAFSNNARGSFGPATWDAAAFTLSPGANVQRIGLGGAF